MSGLSFKLTSLGRGCGTMWCPRLLMTVLMCRKKHSSIQKQVNFVVLGWVRVKRFRASVDFKDAEDVRRGWRTAHAVESEGRARDGLQLRAFVQPQEAGHLAGLQEVERVRPGGGGRPVTLHALQLLRPLADGHHIQLHILRLLLVEQHLRRQRQRTCHHERLAETLGEHISSQLSKWKQTRLPQDFQGPTIATLSFFFFLFFYPDFLQASALTGQKSGYMRLPETWFPPLQKNSTVWLMFVQNKGCFYKKLKNGSASQDCADSL